MAQFRWSMEWIFSLRPVEDTCHFCSPPPAPSPPAVVYEILISNHCWFAVNMCIGISGHLQPSQDDSFGTFHGKRNFFFQTGKRRAVSMRRTTLIIFSSSAGGRGKHNLFAVVGDTTCQSKAPELQHPGHSWTSPPFLLLLGRSEGTF